MGARSFQVLETLVQLVDFLVQFIIEDGQVVINDEHIAVLFLHIETFGAEQDVLDIGFAEEFDEGGVFGQATLAAEQQLGAKFLWFDFRIFAHQFFSLWQNGGNQRLLSVVQFFDDGFVAVELLLVAAWSGSRDNKRGTGIINEDGIDLIHDGVVMGALHQLGQVARHIVTQVVETEFVVGAVSDVGFVGFAAILRVGFMLVDAIDGQAVELIKEAHPLAVALGEVVVHGNHVHALAWKCVEVNRKRSHQSLSFTGRHLRDFTLMENHTTNELHVEVAHIPLDHIAARHPGIVVTGFAVHDFNAIAGGCEVHVALGGSHLNNLVVFETASSLLHHRKSLGQNVVEHLLRFLVGVLFQMLHLLVKLLFVGNGHIVIVVQFQFDFSDAVFVFLNRFTDDILEFKGLGTEFIIRQFLDVLIRLQNAVFNRVQLFEVSICFSTKQFR